MTWINGNLKCICRKTVVFLTKHQFANISHLRGFSIIPIPPQMHCGWQTKWSNQTMIFKMKKKNKHTHENHKDKLTKDNMKINILLNHLKVWNDWFVYQKKSKYIFWNGNYFQTDCNKECVTSNNDSQREWIQMKEDKT